MLLRWTSIWLCSYTKNNQIQLLFYCPEIWFCIKMRIGDKVQYWFESNGMIYSFYLYMLLCIHLHLNANNLTFSSNYILHIYMEYGRSIPLIICQTFQSHVNRVCVYVLQQSKSEPESNSQSVNQQHILWGRTQLILYIQLKISQKKLYGCFIWPFVYRFTMHHAIDDEKEMGMRCNWMRMGMNMVRMPVGLWIWNWGLEMRLGYNRIDNDNNAHMNILCIVMICKIKCMLLLTIMCQYNAHCNSLFHFHFISNL